MKVHGEKVKLSHALTFEARLSQARKQRQNLILLKWLVLAIALTLLLVYLLAPIGPLLFN